MAARTGMTDLISRLRGMTSAGTADYTVNLISYWSDDHLQNVLDAHRLDFYEQELDQITAVESAVVVYKTYRAPYRNLEGSTVNFILADFQGTPAGTADYTADYFNGVISFSANQAGKIWYLTGHSFDLYAAAAEVWRMKAAHASETSFDFSTDNHSIKGSNLPAQCLKMADYYEKQSMMSSVNINGPQSILIERSDT